MTNDRPPRIALVGRLLRNAVQLALPGQRLQAGDEVAVTFRGIVGSPDAEAEIVVPRAGGAAGRAVLSGEDGVLFVLRWSDLVVE
ncbi:hypothetical protein [Nonomuraea africana]|uniref:hypothetical protein n=1 Tax=Nonomuraea africana TaxID=46171 RepID=UPI0033F72481